MRQATGDLHFVPVHYPNSIPETGSIGTRDNIIGIRLWNHVQTVERDERSMNPYRV